MRVTASLMIVMLAAFLVCTVAVWRGHSSVLYLTDSIAVATQPTTSGPMLVKTLRNMQSMSEDPLRYVLQDQYEPLLNASTAMRAWGMEMLDMARTHNVTNQMMDIVSGIRLDTENAGSMLQTLRDMLHRMQAPFAA
jgi:hypothetical protein